MIIKKNCRIGIWGFGVVGKSIINHLYVRGHKIICVMDKRILTTQEYEFLKQRNVTWYNQEKEEELFFNSCEIIIPSPGVNINGFCYATHHKKWRAELDLFYNNFKKPIIAVTGSIGKTSVVHILGELLKNVSIPVAIGGNIGIPMFDLLATQDSVDYALLEVSSFQLLHCIQFAPYLAIITNFHSNHLDYHATQEEYFSAKFNILRLQKENTLSLIPFALRQQAPAIASNHLRAYFTSGKPSIIELEQLTANEQVFYIENNTVIRYAQNTYVSITALTSDLLNFSFLDNILLLVSVCDLMHFNPAILQTIATTFTLPEHRMEKIGTFNNVEFYNDSKATTTASTFAAVEKLKNRPLHIFIGGLSKGVDRTSFIMQLKNSVKHIYCFGNEADALYALCIKNTISASHHVVLEDATARCLSMIRSGDCVLFSPSGSSYDLYKNYEERGTHFKKLLADFIQK